MSIAVICGLAGWRLARLALTEDGPFQMLSRGRALVGVPEQGELRGPFQGILTCMWCATVWSSAAAWLCWEYAAEWPVIILAAAAVAVAVEEADQWSRSPRQS